MPRVCTVCSHRERAAINQRLVDGCGSLRQIAKDYGVSESSLHRHNRDHLPGVLRAGASAARQNESVELEAVAVQRAAEPADLLGRVRKLYTEAEQVLAEAKVANDPRVALLALDRLLKSLALEGVTLQAAAERGEGGPQRVVITWAGETCAVCGHNPLAPRPQPRALPEPGEGQSGAPSVSASDKPPRANGAD